MQDFNGNNFLIKSFFDQLMMIQIKNWNLFCIKENLNDNYLTINLKNQIKDKSDSFNIEISGKACLLNNKIDCINHLHFSIESDESNDVDFELHFAIYENEIAKYKELTNVIIEIIEKHNVFKYINYTIKNEYDSNETALSRIIEYTENNVIDWKEYETEPDVDDKGYYGEVHYYTAEYGDEKYNFVYHDETAEYKDKVEDDDEEAYDPYLDTPSLVINVGDYLEIRINNIMDNDVIENITGITSKHIITVEDIIVRTNHLACINSGHELQQVTAKVSVFDSTMHEIEIEASYCPICDRYYMLESSFRYLKSLGHICCQVIEFEKLKKMERSSNEWKDESVLRSYGYTVSEKEGLSVKERHNILDFVIENDILTKDDVIDFLRWLIRTNDSVYSKQKAVRKWKDDIDYLDGRGIGNAQIKVNKIFKKKSY